MATNFNFAIIATDQKSGLWGDDGKGGMAVGATGPWAKGYQVLKGDWYPEGMAVREFYTEEEARRWMETADGKAYTERYESIILVRIKA